MRAGARFLVFAAAFVVSLPGLEPTSAGATPASASSSSTLLGLRSASTAFVAAEHPLAVAAGTEILAQGGNATDAAIAAVAASGVVHPVSCGLGGGGFMLIYDGATGKAHVLDYRETAPADATAARFLDRGMTRIETGPLSVGVPGEPAGLVAAHRRFGSLPLPTILSPAIRYARDGFHIDAHLADAIAEERELLRGDPTLAATFLRPDGAPRTTGDRLHQPQLAASLELLASNGAAPFYEGDVAHAIATAAGADGGLLSPADLTAYRVRWREPLIGTYRDRRIFTMPPPGSGGIVLEALNVLSAFDLPALGFASPTYLHLLAETMKAVFEDRARYYGDPEFATVPVARLLSASHTGTIRARLSSTRLLDAKGKAADDAGTAHVSVVDGAGNAVAATTTINTAFGAGITAPGTGITLNNQLADFSLRSGATNVFGLLATDANVIAPGKRPLSSMSPTVVVRGRSPEIVIGGSGGPTIITATLQTLLALIDFGMDPAAATAAPLMHHQGAPPVLLVEPGIPPATRTSLALLGHQVREVQALGSVSVVRVAAGVAAGAGAVRKGGVAASPKAVRDAAELPASPIGGVGAGQPGPQSSTPVAPAAQP
jgi:gamma-glutamyltranspeptidase/glutathione hydrolase